MGLYSGLELLTEDFWKRYPHVRALPQAAAWVEHLAAIRYADRSICSYASELELYLEFCAAAGEDAVTSEIRVVDKYFSTMQRVGRDSHKVIRMETRTGLSRATLNHRAAVLKVWFAYLLIRGDRENNPLDGRRFGARGVRVNRTYIRKVPSNPFIPDNASWWALCAYLKQYCDERDRFMMRLSYDCALRVSELVAVDVEHFDWHQMLLHVPAGKGEVARTVPFSASLETAFERYIAFRSQVRQGPGPLFVSRSNRNYGNRVKAGTWNDRVEEIRAAISMPLLHTHTMRHLACTDLARQGMPIQDIAAFAGHRSLKTTQVYINISGASVKKALKGGMSDLREWRAAVMDRLKD